MATKKKPEIEVRSVAPYKTDRYGHVKVPKVGLVTGRAKIEHGAVGIRKAMRLVTAHHNRPQPLRGAKAFKAILAQRDALIAAEEQ